MNTMICPHCGYGLTDHSATDGTDVQPEADDRSICLSCGGLLIFTENPDGGLMFRVPTPEEREESLNDMDIVSAQAAIQLLRDSNPDWPKGSR